MSCHASAWHLLPLLKTVDHESPEGFPAGKCELTPILDCFRLFYIELSL